MPFFYIPFFFIDIIINYEACFTLSTLVIPDMYKSNEILFLFSFILSNAINLMIWIMKTERILLFDLKSIMEQSIYGK